MNKQQQWHKKQTKQQTKITYDMFKYYTRLLSFHLKTTRAEPCKKLLYLNVSAGKCEKN